ncbi:restriction endonuclease subunit S [Listeria immobilis]|uniref:restriction endonuclease subunit S n=1 Tax=Listeria immobilis TaxID=2713502 RepID=UPI001627A0B4|nr:restriction endonuclease subunit S [Listeria immobilis]MBC1515979.1 restriction endonuclease subunit S [Listeria immobilis]
MKGERKTAPVIRFKGFSDAWEQRKLEELATFSKGNSYTKNDLIDNGKPIILYGRLYTRYQTVIEAVDTFAKEKFNSVISEGNEVLVPASGETSEEISRASVIGKSGVVLGGDLNIIKPNESIDSIFLALTISNGGQKKELSKRAQGKSVVHLHNSDLKQVNLLYPKLEEQQKIGIFFKQLDNTIALHQRKLDSLKLMKKGFLQLMFPKKGERAPKLRFADFVEEWEQRKLGKHVNIKSGWSPSHFEITDKIGDLFIKVDDLNYSNRIQSDSNMKVNIHSKYQKMKKGCTLFPKRGAAIMTNKVRILGKDSYMDTNMMALEPDGIDAEFLYTFISRTGLYKIADTSTIPQINNKHIEPYEINIPENEEQQKIGTFFKQLDNTIALHQNKLDKLNTLKKACLQNMFI